MLAFNSPGQVTQGTHFSGNPITGSGNMALLGGTLVLNAANTYSGGTTLYGGTLIVANTAASATGAGPVTLNGGMLASMPGSVDIIGGNVAAGRGAHQIAPGGIGGIGTMSILGKLALNGNTTLDFDIQGGRSDSLTVAGGLAGIIGLRNGRYHNNGGTLSPSYTLATFTGGVSSGVAFSPENVPQATN